ncbi:MAG: carboxymuconolactone decarboxylase family protein [Actinomycetota bacterium]
MADEATTSWVTGDRSSIDDLLELRPDLAELWHRFESELWNDPQVDPVLLELCRLRLAQVHDAPVLLSQRSPRAVEAGLSEELVAALPNWSSDDRFDAATRTALGVTELFVIDVHSVTDEQMAELLEHLGAPGVMTVTTGLALWDGIARFERVLGAT